MFGVIPCKSEDILHDEQNHPIERLIGASVSNNRSTDVDYRHLLDSVPNQANTNSCVAQWFSTAIYLAGQAQGRPVPRPSVRWAYNVARYIDQPNMLVDLGSSARDMCFGCSRHGIISEDRFPFEPAKVNEPPPFDADIAGADALFTGYYRASTADDIHVALEQGHFPGTAIRVYSNFMSWNNEDTYVKSNGKFEGLHMLTAIGCKPGKILYLNSWGKNWGSGGFIWIADSFVDSSEAFDKYVVTAAPIS